MLACFLFPQECLDCQTKAVFVVESLLPTSTVKQIEGIVKESDFQHATVFCLSSPNIQDFVAMLQHAQTAQRVLTYGDLSKGLKMWMGNEVCGRFFPTGKIAKGFLLLVSYVKERPWWPIQSPNRGRKKKGKS